jgi:predicted ATPase
VVKTNHQHSPNSSQGAFTMELTLTVSAGYRVTMDCDGQPSHEFDLKNLIPAEEIEGRPPQPLEDPVGYGQAVYAALFPKGSFAKQTLDNEPDRILLFLEDDLQAIPWEYVCGPDGFLVLDFPFVRGLPEDKRIDPPNLGQPLHILAVPSNPLGEGIPPLNIEGEWLRLSEIIREMPYGITLERTRPPTIDRLRSLIANQTNRVVHFMGHGSISGDQAILLFEKETGEPQAVTGKDFAQTTRGSTFLVTLNACVSTTPGETEFSNLAYALIKRKIPYALGMRFSIPDVDALTFSRRFYDELARGIAVEDALLQARRSLLRDDPRKWLVGVPVLYTSLKMPARCFTISRGKPFVDEHQPKMDVTVLPKVEGTFQGRVKELLALGSRLTGDQRARLLTIQGAGGQGKTALAREAVERFAWAWPGGVWAISLENLPDRAMFVTRLADFLNISIDLADAPDTIERQVLAALEQRRMLIVLDNAETLVEAVKAGDQSTRELAAFLREGVRGTLAGLLVTSREHLGWPGEEILMLPGLSPNEGAQLFRQSAPQRQADMDLPQAQALSRQVDGHPLSLRLLGGAFNQTSLGLGQFIEQFEVQLLSAEDRYKAEDHRHRKLFAAIDTSVRFLPESLRLLLSGLWVFAGAFLPKTAVEVFDPEGEYGEGEHSPVLDDLNTLWGRSLLEREMRTFREGRMLLYRLLPVVRVYIRQYLEQAQPEDSLLERHARAYGALMRLAYRELDRRGDVVYLAQQSWGDFEQATKHQADEDAGWYWLRWGWVAGRLGDRKTGMSYLEKALERAQDSDQELELKALNNLAMVYRATGQPGKALELYEQALPIRREVGDRAGEAATLNNLAGVYSATGQPGKALELFEQALPIAREVGDRAGEAITCFNMALLLRDRGEAEKAIELLRQAVALERQVQHPDYQQDATMLSEWEKALQNGDPLPGSKQTPRLSQEQLQTIIHNTIFVMTRMSEKQQEWREAVSVMVEKSQNQRWQKEMDFFQAILAILNGDPPELPQGHPYAAAVQSILAGIEQGGSPSAESENPMQQALLAFLNTESWEATRAAVEQDHELLYSPEVEKLLEAWIDQAQREGNENTVQLLRLHLGLLRDCKQNGIGAAFDRLEAAMREAQVEVAYPEGIPEDFVDRCVEGLKGTPQDKQALFEYLGKLAAQPDHDPGFGELIKTIQLALFSSDLSSLGEQLPAEYKLIWNKIVELTSGR